MPEAPLAAGSNRHKKYGSIVSFSIFMAPAWQRAANMPSVPRKLRCYAWRIRVILLRETGWGYGYKCQQC